MNVIKIVKLTVTEKVQNVVARADEKAELSIAGHEAMIERKAAEDKAGKLEAIAHYHARQAEILRQYEQKKAEHKAEKERKKAALRKKKTDKHGNKRDVLVGDEEHPTSASPTSSDTSEPTSPTQKAVHNRNTSTPACSNFPEPASEAREDMTATNPDTADSPAVDYSEVPMHGSGVPTHSKLHNDGDDPHDIHTTQTMGASPNTGSYM